MDNSYSRRKGEAMFSVPENPWPSNEVSIFKDRDATPSQIAEDGEEEPPNGPNSVFLLQKYV